MWLGGLPVGVARGWDSSGGNRFIRALGVARFVSDVALDEF